MYKHTLFNKVLKKYKYKLHLGDITAGYIFSEEKRGFLVDIGTDILAYLPKDETSIHATTISRPIRNHSREFFILGYNQKSTQIILSIKRLEYIRNWQRIKQIDQEDIILELYIHKINRGGLLTQIEGLQGFIPNSHIADMQTKYNLLHKYIPCQFLALYENKNQILLSHRKAILRKSLNFFYIGQIIEGKIRKITNYGIFIKIYNFLALLHISEIEKSRKRNLTLFNPGTNISVQIIHIDKKQGRISVSRKYIQ